MGTSTVICWVVRGSFVGRALSAPMSCFEPGVATDPMGFVIPCLVRYVR